MSLHRQNPIHTFLVISGGRATFNALIFTVNLIYHVETVGLNPLQLVMVGMVLELTTFLFEVPTGVVADVYSRRLSVIIGMALVGSGFLLEGWAPLFWTVLTAQVLWGIGYTFISGALQAWLAGEIGADATGPVFLRSSQLGLIAGLVGTGISVWLAQTWLQLPIILGGALYIALAAYLALTMPEEGFRPSLAEERGTRTVQARGFRESLYRSTWKQMAETTRSGLLAVRGHQALLILMGLSLVTGLYSEGYDRLWTPHLLGAFSFPALPGFGAAASASGWANSVVIWFGIIRLGSTVVGLAANEFARRWRATEEQSRIVNWLTLLYGLLPASLLLLAWTRNFWLAMLALWAISLGRSTIDPLQGAWIVRNTPSAHRATIISFWGQLDAIGQIVGGPLVGWIGTIARLPLALTTSAALLMPSQWLLALARRHKSPRAVAAQD